MKNGASWTVAIDGLLHDAFEDAGVPPQTIKEQLADEVAELVNGASQSEEHRRESTDKKETWKRREANAIAQTINRGFDLKLISGADILSNLSDSLTTTNNEEPKSGEDSTTLKRIILALPIHAESLHKRPLDRSDLVAGEERDELSARGGVNL